MNRKATKKIRVGDLYIGGDAPITIQSMTKTDTRDWKATIDQIKELEEVGCDIVRIAVPDIEAAEAIKNIKKNTNIPIVADIHFDYRLALESIKNGVDKLRINPGNIGDRDRVKQVVNAAMERNIPIRIGVNAGSISPKILDQFNGVNAESMIESALEHINILEALNFEQIIISLKASNVLLTLEAYELISKKTNYPLHIGITEAGTKFSGTIKSSIGIGILLARGIGDTIRVSLTDDPKEEVLVAKEILKSLNLYKGNAVELISCPTCGRTQINLMDMAKELEMRLNKLQIKKTVKVAIMGCAVNGPGEAKEADIGIAGGKGSALIFKKGEIIRQVNEKNIIEELLEEILKMQNQPQ